MAKNQFNCKEFKGKDIVIIGPPASGKTFLSGMCGNGHTVFHADEFIEQYGYKEGLYELMNAIKLVNGPVLVEGTLGYRLLRKGAELNCFAPDVVIELSVPSERIAQTYREQRPSKDYSSVLRSIKANATVLADYLAYTVKLPMWIKIENNY